MSTIKLIPPKGYTTIKPLHDSTGRPIRCVAETDDVQDAVNRAAYPECATCSCKSNDREHE